MPRRVPVPVQHTAPVASVHASYPDPVIPPAPYSVAAMMDTDGYQGTAAVEVIPQPVPVNTAKASGSGKDGERKRKGGKSKKRA
tara:strand:- start:9505 stop:9756 length:252 start_codon:yes stop_codon:yes gene_type:complete